MSGATALLEINTSLFNDNKMIELRMENINNFYTLLAVADPKIKDKILPIKNMGFVGKPMMEEDITRTEISLLLTNQNQLPLTTLQAKNPNTSLFIVPNLSDYPSLLLYITKIPVDSSQLLSTIDVVLH
ncbi:MAG: hypothetical protein LBG52_05300 [Candidatus Peribacteria bacterium]|jgi:hypothetical protein|nr:hypothetical protein [Candidatus Peribacteria bacterium]